MNAPYRKTDSFAVFCFVFGALNLFQITPFFIIGCLLCGLISVWRLRNPLRGGKGWLALGWLFGVMAATDHALFIYEKNGGHFLQGNESYAIQEKPQSNAPVTPPPQTRPIDPVKDKVLAALTRLRDGIKKNEPVEIGKASAACQILEDRILHSSTKSDLDMLRGNLDTAATLGYFYISLCGLETALNESPLYFYKPADDVKPVYGYFKIIEVNIDPNDARWCRVQWKDRGSIYFRTTTGENAVGATFNGQFYTGIRKGSDMVPVPALYQNGQEAIQSFSRQQQIALCKLWPEDVQTKLGIIKIKCDKAWDIIKANLGYNGSVILANVPMTLTRIDAIQEAIGVTVDSMIEEISNESDRTRQLSDSNSN